MDEMETDGSRDTSWLGRRDQRVSSNREERKISAAVEVIVWSIGSGV